MELLDELLHELLLTTFIAALCSYLVAKLFITSAVRNNDPSTLSQENSKFNDNSYFGDEKAMKVEGFKGEERVDDAVLGKVNEFQHVCVVEWMFSRVGSSEKNLNLIVGLPGNSSEAISGEVTDGFESVDDDGCCIDENIESGEFSSENIEVKRDFINDEVKGGEFTAENEMIKDDDELRYAGTNEISLSSDDDDWEGIEISEREKIFAEAVKFVASRENEESISGIGSDVLMELDALHKVVIEGPCLESRPMAFKVSARAKWNARQRLGNMNPDTAMEQYVALLSQKIPAWMEGTSGKIKSELAAGATPSKSSFTSSTYPYNPHSNAERQLEPVSSVREGDRVKSTDLDKEME